MRTILTTVGISLAAENKHGGSTPNDQVLSNYLRHTDPVIASAETNSLSRILQERDNIIFLYSQTDKGKLCAEALCTHYRSQKYNAELQEIPHLTYTESSFKVKGLRSLVSTLIELVQKYKSSDSDEVLINATGGFKAEMAYANLIGLVFNVPVFYIHELFKDIIMMPAPPIGWDYSLIADYEEFFVWIVNDLHTTAIVDRRLSELPEDIRFLLADEDGYTTLSPIGEVFFGAFRERQTSYAAVPIWLSDEALKTYEEAPANTKEIFARTLRKLRDPLLRNNGSGLVGNCDCRVYPRGNRTERLFWFEDENELLRVCELALHGDNSYDRLIERGVNKAMYSTFKEWEDPLKP